MKKIFPYVVIISLVAFSSLACNLLASMTPTLVIQPTPTPVPGWARFEGKGFELWLPDSFQGGDLSKDLDVIVSNLKALGPDYEKYAEQIKKNPSSILLLAFDSKLGPDNVLSNVAVSAEKVLSAITVDIYMDALANQLPKNFTVIEKSKVKLDTYEAGRLTVDIPNANEKQVYYIIKDGNQVYGIVYTTGKSEFETRLPVFEKSVNTFQVIK